MTNTQFQQSLRVEANRLAVELVEIDRDLEGISLLLGGSNNKPPSPSRPKPKNKPKRRAKRVMGICKAIQGAIPLIEGEIDANGVVKKLKETGFLTRVQPHLRVTARQRLSELAKDPDFGLSRVSVGKYRYTAIS